MAADQPAPGGAHPRAGDAPPVDAPALRDVERFLRPRLLVDFEGLDQAEAEEYFRQFEERLPERLAGFRARVASLSGAWSVFPSLRRARRAPDAAELDLGRSSLVAVGATLDRFAQERYGKLDLPRDAAGLPFLTIAAWRERVADEPDDLPPWCHENAANAPSPMPPAVLALVDGLALYLGEALRAAVPALRWSVQHAHPGIAVDGINEPALLGPGVTVPVPGLAYGVGLRSMAGTPAAERLPEAFDLWRQTAEAAVAAAA